MIGEILLGPILSTVGKVLDKVVPDAGKRDELKAALSTAILSNQAEITKAAAGVITAEAQGESRAQREWRPHLMYVIMGLLVWNAVCVPMIAAIFGVHIPIENTLGAIPPQLWQLLMIGVGGYVVGRSGEKMMRERRATGAQHDN